jgi:hypothetical protein
MEEGKSKKNSKKKDSDSDDIKDSSFIKNGYVRPKTTITDQLTKDEINEKLEDYVKVDDIYKVPLGTHLRYFSKDKKTGELKFRLGGQLYNNKGLPKYVILKAVNAQFSVQVKDTVFWRKLSMVELKKEYEDYITEMDEKYNKLKEKYSKLKDENNALNSEIEIYKEELKKFKKR